MALLFACPRASINSVAVRPIATRATEPSCDLWGHESGFHRSVIAELDAQLLPDRSFCRLEANALTRKRSRG